jgi:hypothetical protein
MTDIQAAYKLAFIEEYEGYRRAGRDADAEQVATILREHYGHEVAPKAKAKAKPEQDAPERTDAERLPENATPAKPAARTAAKRTPAKKSDQ